MRGLLYFTYYPFLEADLTTVTYGVPDCAYRLPLSRLPGGLLGNTRRSLWRRGAWMARSRMDTASHAAMVPMVPCSSPTWAVLLCAPPPPGPPSQQIKRANRACLDKEPLLRPSRGMSGTGWFVSPRTPTDGGGPGFWLAEWLRASSGLSVLRPGLARVPSRLVSHARGVYSCRLIAAWLAWGYDGKCPLSFPAGAVAVRSQRGGGKQLANEVDPNQSRCWFGVESCFMSQLVGAACRCHWRMESLSLPLHMGQPLQLRLTSRSPRPTDFCCISFSDPLFFTSTLVPSAIAAGPRGDE